MVIAYRLEYQEIEYEGKEVINNGGFSTAISRGSKEHWDYAQSICPKIFMIYGKILLLFECIVTYITLKYNIFPVYLIGTVVGILFILIAFIRIDKEVSHMK